MRMTGRHVALALIWMILAAPLAAEDVRSRQHHQPDQKFEQGHAACGSHWPPPRRGR